MGKILVGEDEVLVSLNVKTKLLLFDSNIVVLNPDFKVTQGEQLKTLVTLTPLGDQERLDVTLNFMIKDYENKIYLTKSETLLISNLTEIKRDFDMGLIPPGDYVVGLELVYSNGLAPSSAHFRVIEKSVTSPYRKVLLFFATVLVFIILIVIIELLHKWKRRKFYKVVISKLMRKLIRR